MNHIYRLIWNTALNCWMVASERTKGRGKRATRTLAAASVLILSLPALAVEAIPDVDGTEVQAELPAAQPWLPMPYAFATGLVAREVGTNSTHYQYAIITDASYQNASITGNNSVIVGSRSSMNGYNSVGYGNVVEVNGNMASAVGAYAKAIGVGATAIGAEAQATKGDAVAVGHAATATAYDAVAVGYRTNAAGQDSIAIGSWTTSAGRGSLALGRSAKAAAAQSVAIGTSTSIDGGSANGIAMGYSAKVEVNSSSSMALGDQAVASGGSAVAIGARSSVVTHGGVGGIAIGADAAAGAPGYSGSIAVGSSSKATFNGVAMGASAQATANGAIALGSGSIANASNTVSVGNSSTKRRIVNVADGELSSTSTDAVTGKQVYKTTQDVTTALTTATAAKNTAESALARLNNSRTAIGLGAAATGTNATALGQAASASGTHATALGQGASATGGHSHAFGTGAKAAGENAVAVGTLASATSYDAIAVGDRAAVAAGSVGGMALGANAAVNANAGKAVALGANSVATELDAVSVGNSTLKRKIVNVGDGAVSATSTDAVTGRQLHGVKTTADAVSAQLSGSKTALGKDSKAEGVNATAVGLASNASGSHGTAVGRSAGATGDFSLAMGSGSLASMKSTVALGDAAAATGNYSAALGYKAAAEGGYSTAFGYEAAAGGISSIALGSLAKSSATHSIALGDRAQVDAAATESLALGHYASVAAGAKSAVALGYGSVATDENSVSVGSATIKRKIVNVADAAVSAASTEAVTGRQLHATDVRVTAADTKAATAGSAAAAADLTATAAKASADALTARFNHTRFSAGEGATAGGVNSTAIGYKAAASGSHSNAMGHEATTGGANAVAIGTLAAAGSDMAVAVGNRAAVDVTAAGGLAVGNYAKVNAGATNAIALGANSVASAKDTVSVGSSTLQRRVVNVAEGALSSASNDAVTGKQLFATNLRVDTLGGLVGQVSDAGAVRLGAETAGTMVNIRNKANATRTISGLADGVVGAGSDEAVTGNQLHRQQTTINDNAQRITANLGRINSNQTAVGTNRDAIAGNRSSIDGNRDDIAALRSDFDEFAPDLDGVVMFNEDRTRVDMEGARVTGLMEGSIASNSTDAVTGGQLFLTHNRIAEIEADRNYIALGDMLGSEGSSAGLLGVAIGAFAEASLDNEGGVAVGSFALARGANSVALGRASHVQQDAEEGFALGTQSLVRAEGAIAAGARAQVLEGARNSVALGYASIASEAYTVSVGGDAVKRRVVNVGRGMAASDATVVEQLNESLAGLGGGATVGASGEIVGPTYTLRSGGVYNDVGTALAALDGTVVTTRSDVDSLDSRLNRLFQEEATARTDGAGRLSLGGAQGMVLGNVANGMIAPGSRDAVNGGQLYATNQQVGQNRDAISGLREELSGVEQRGVRSVMNSDEPSFNFGGSRLTGVGAGDITSAGSKDAVNGGQLFASNARISGLEEQHSYFVVGSDELSLKARAGIVAVAVGDSAEASLSSEGATAIGSFARARARNSVALGRAAHVHENAAEGFALGSGSQVEVSRGMALGPASVVKASASNSVALGYASMADQAATISVGNSTYQRRIVNVAHGTANHDAATVGQLKGIASAFGGSVEVDANGNPTAPSFNVQGGNYRSVGDALSALDSSVNDTDKSVGALDSRLNRLFQEEATTRTDGPGRLNLGGAQGMVLGNVANGMIAAGSRDAVNGGQLYEVRKDLQGQIDGLAERGGERVALSGRMAAPAPMSAQEGGAMVASADAPASTPTPTPTPLASEASTPEPVVKAEGENAVAVGSEGKERSVRHVAKGTADTDAVNVRQLNDVLQSANEYTDLAVEGLNKRLDGMDKRFNRMAAMSSAQSAMAMNTAGLNTYNRLGAGVGHSDGESALAVGYQRVMNERGSATFSLNGAFTNSGEKTVGVGVGIGW